jgi:hypothetical protein
MFAKELDNYLKCISCRYKFFDSTSRSTTAPGHAVKISTTTGTQVPSKEGFEILQRIIAMLPPICYVHWEGAKGTYVQNNKLTK